MKTLLGILLVLLFSTSALARQLPSTLQMGTISSVSGNKIAFKQKNSSLVNTVISWVIDTSKTYTTAPGIRIYDTQNRMLLTGQIATLLGKTVGVTLDTSGDINRIWVLTDDEVSQIEHQTAS